MRYMFLVLSFIFGCGGAIQKTQEIDTCDMRYATIYEQPYSTEMIAKYNGRTFLLHHGNDFKSASFGGEPFIYENKNEKEIQNLDPKCLNKDMKLYYFSLQIIEDKNDSNFLIITPVVKFESKIPLLTHSPKIRVRKKIFKPTKDKPFVIQILR